jgi:hypothetical protein
VKLLVDLLQVQQVQNERRASVVLTIWYYGPSMTRKFRRGGKGVLVILGFIAAYFGAAIAGIIISGGARVLSGQQ